MIKRYQSAMFILIGIVLHCLALIWSCSKTTIWNETKPIRYQRETKEARSFTPRDTTDTTKHEITFGPTIIGWEVVDVETEL